MLEKLKENWENFVTLKQIPKNIRPEILESWQRCEKLNLDYRAGKGTKVSDKILQESLDKRKELIEVARPIMKDVFEVVKNTSYSVVLTDENGIIIDIIMSKEMEETHNKINFTLGSLWDEKSVGSNAISICLILDKPIQMIGAEHYCEYHHVATCSAAPIHNSKGEMIGCFNLSGFARDVQTHTYGLSILSANSIEKQLAILESYKLMDTAFDSMLDGIFFVNSSMKIYKFNNHIPEIFKLDDKEVYNINVGETFKDFNIVNNIFNNKQKMKYSDMTLHIKNKKIECSLSISPIIMGDEAIGAVFLIKESKQITKEVSKLAGFKANYTFDSIVTVNPRMIELINTCKKISKTNCSVLIEGESGTGKELFAQSIHNESFRRKGPFVALNCSAIPKELFESELFGYESNSFTGAMKGGRPGKFELANGGTIFLDEVGEIPLDIQPKLLRVLDNNKIVRIGGTHERDLDVRVLAATNRNLLEEISGGSFRQDLYYRLNVINLRIPPLRNRQEDILELARRFLSELNKENEGANKELGDQFITKLIQHNWFGNVRELRNIIQRAYYMSEGYIINNVVFQKSVNTNNNTEIMSFNLKEVEKERIVQALLANKRDVIKAAESLNISRATIYRKIKAYSIDLNQIEKISG